MDEQPTYLMRFVGFKEDGSGELKRGSPAGYKKDELRELRFDNSLEPYWEIVDDIPDLVLPEEEPEDSAFEEEPETREKYVMPVEGDPEEVTVIYYDKMTVPTLKHFIEQRGGEVDPKWLKADLIREAQELEESLRATSEDAAADTTDDVMTAEPAEEPLKTLVDKQNELAKRYHDGDMTSDQYRELSDKLNKEHSQPES